MKMTVTQKEVTSLIPGTFRCTFRCNRPVCNTCDFVSHVTVVTGAYNSFLYPPKFYLH